MVNHPVSRAGTPARGGSTRARVPDWARPLDPRQWNPRRRVNDEPAEHFAGFIATALLVGAVTGLVTATFRYALIWLGNHRRAWAVELHAANPWWIVPFALVCSAGASLAAWLVHHVEPHAEGSGIPRVEGIVEGRIRPGRRRILPVKYVGGLLAIGSGLVLGREGPSVQMGGSVAINISRLTRRNDDDLRVLVAAGAAAGLATAFNAPIAGGVFVLEELVKRFDPRTTLATLTASAAGFGVSHELVHGTDFHVAPLLDPTLRHAPLVIAVGLLTGVLGAAYNSSVVWGLRRARALAVPVELRAAVIGLAIGVVVWFWPQLGGGGDSLTLNALLGRGTILSVLAILVARWAMGIVSYAAGTPGGLFAPMLVLGSGSGLLVGLVAVALWPSTTLQPAALAVMGFASFFTASVRAPVTGLILATEMTGSVTMLPPSLGACAVAMLTATLLRSEPLYDALVAPTPAAASSEPAPTASIG